MSPFNSPYLTQNNHSKYIEISSGKTHLSNQWHHLMFVIWKYNARENLGVKVNWFLNIVWKISNLDKSIHLICKIQSFLTSGLEIYAIWVECLVNKLSKITDVNSGFIRVIVTQGKRNGDPFGYTFVYKG